jgi:hypothetical protein
LQHFAKILKEQQQLRESNSIQAGSNLTHQTTLKTAIWALVTNNSFAAIPSQSCRFSLGGQLRPACEPFGLMFALPEAKGRKGVTMDFAIILIVSNTLLAGFIYFVVTRIWQD